MKMSGELCTVTTLTLGKELVMILDKRKITLPQLGLEPLMYNLNPVILLTQL
jgi:hypothetical protein